MNRKRIMIHTTGVMLFLLFTSVAIWKIGRKSGAFGQQEVLRVSFRHIEGLRAGDGVRLQGMRVGTVGRILPPMKAGEPVVAELRIDSGIVDLLRKDAVIKIESQGIIGQPVVEIEPGAADAEPIELGQVFEGSPSTSFRELTGRAQQSLEKLEKVANEAETGLVQINKVLNVIGEGKGTVGRILMEDEAYKRMMAVGQRGERALDDLEENLESLKQSWFFSKMFDQRGFRDRDSVLFMPRSDVVSRSLATSELFEPETAKLTEHGREQLDRAVVELRPGLKAESELIIAAFTDGPMNDENIARILTQKQAEAVRDYLETAHQISYVSLFQWRKLTAVGFGTTVPAHWKNETGELNRVDVIVATPRSSAGND